MHFDMDLFALLAGAIGKRVAGLGS